ncbi:hybrid sensor histidine kinase/response regulator transcription factor [Bacteroides sedimenti]|uniref:histidine kinase n=1 Tax=Bacteroides sedimenti TaxID=2136147 RepID=A0ABM8IJ18_9BACE
MISLLTDIKLAMKRLESLLKIKLLIASLILFSEVLFSVVNANTSIKYYFRSLQVEDGLSQNMVYSILQDKQGFMWFGTQDGLNRYDGTAFKIFKFNISDSHSIGSNAIFSLMQDDSGLIWVGTSNGVYLYDPTLEYFSSLKVDDKLKTNIKGVVRDICKDRIGNVWFAVSNKGIFCYSPEGKVRQYILPLKQRNSNIRRILFDAEGNLWVATYWQGLYKMNVQTGRFTHYIIARNGQNSLDNDINDIYLLNQKTLLIGTSSNGVLSFDTQSCKFSTFLDKGASGNSLFVRRIFRAMNGELWIGTESGLFVYNLKTNKIVNLHHVPNDLYSISDNAVHSICQDREGGMWIGTFFGGVNYFSSSLAQFEKYYPMNNENSVSGKSISEFCEDDRQRIWIGTEDAGLNCFDPATGDFEKGFISAKNIHALLYDRGYLWVGTFSDGLFVMNLKIGQIHSYKNGSSVTSLNNNNIYSIYKDSSGTIWVGTMLGLHQYNLKTNDFTRIREHSINCQVNDIIEDKDGILWFATLGQGLYSYNKRNKRWKHYLYPMSNKLEKAKMITCLCVDSNKHLWVGSEGAGICMYNKSTDSFVNVRDKNNDLPNDVVYRLVVDKQGHIWGSTNKGLFLLNIQNGNIKHYTHSNGLLGDQFNYKSGMISSQGKLYFGGVKGFVAFYPDKLKIKRIPPNVVISSFQIFNKEIQPKAEDSPLDKSVTCTHEISIPNRNSMFSLGFAALSYVSPEEIKYEYKLEGRDNEWIPADQTRRVTYSKLPSGKYVFLVRASNGDGVWGKETALRINVLPPFYSTFWAYIVYIVVIISLVYISLRRYTHLLKNKAKRALQELNNQREKELYNAKIDFFTNITHEIRTPLTLIKAPLEDIMKHVNASNENWENLSIIERNTNRLLTLVNELLDFRKAESKGLNLNFVFADVVLVIKDTVSRFVPTANLKGITVDTMNCETAFYADIDCGILITVLSNILNNALKYANKNILIEFSPQNENICISVTNDGDLIPKEYAEKIFELFFKLNESTCGSGIGLPFAKSLIEMHKGKIYLDNQQSNNTCFIIELPIHQDHAIRLQCEHNTNSPKSVKKKDVGVEIAGVGGQIRRTTILFVEDNDEFQSFLADQLSEKYNLLLASNGKEALQILSQKNIDLIISDIMMPIMDGMSLCKEVKENLKHSHIPVILLTAKTTLQSKIDGMKIGADEYIEKPFSVDYLKVRIENLLENREKIKKTYQNLPELTFDAITYSKADEEFLNSLVELIHSRLDEENLDVNQLASMMNMSRATLYRKIKCISELTPNDFIRLTRLKKAAQLLREKEYRVNEIASIVGFGSSSYFSKCFLKQFGMLPKDFVKKT